MGATSAPNARCDLKAAVVPQRIKEWIRNPINGRSRYQSDKRMNGLQVQDLCFLVVCGSRARVDEHFWFFTSALIYFRPLERNNAVGATCLFALLRESDRTRVRKTTTMTTAPACHRRRLEHLPLLRRQRRRILKTKTFSSNE